jgi:hypothetical protein
MSLSFNLSIFPAFFPLLLDFSALKNNHRGETTFAHSSPAAPFQFSVFTYFLIPFSPKIVWYSLHFPLGNGWRRIFVDEPFVLQHFLSLSLKILPPTMRIGEKGSLRWILLKSRAIWPFPLVIIFFILFPHIQSLRYGFFSSPPISSHFPDYWLASFNFTFLFCANGSSSSSSSSFQFHHLLSTHYSQFLVIASYLLALVHIQFSTSLPIPSFFFLWSVCLQEISSLPKYTYSGGAGSIESNSLVGGGGTSIDIFQMKNLV